ncbi:MAG: dihydrodipicolinate synthase family protein [Thermomicrobiales bacterium]|nr:dihydrodipicolinate synthase family protein [Thermomicrobiales bacterium]MCO5222299.1 dihydrodipicolinate synthase family protein [Thermomicrobiales bacterium]
MQGDQMMTNGLRPGVHCIAATPFLPDESLDLASVGALMDYLIAGGCDGALVLGVLGEADRLSDDERDQVLATALERGGGKLQISVGVTHHSTRVTKARADAAQAAGAAAVMVSPPSGSSAGPALKEHFKQIAADLTIPLIVQDHPTSSGVKMPVEFIASLYEFLPPGSVCKLEDPPTAVKMNKLRDAEPGYQIFGGLGGVSLLHELDAGSAGAMTGFAVVEGLVEIVSLHRNGDRSGARAAYERTLPLLVFEAQPGAGVALRKEILRRRGAIAHATVRQPAPTPDAFALNLLDDLLRSYATDSVV